MQEKIVIRIEVRTSVDLRSLSSGLSDGSEAIAAVRPTILPLHSRDLMRTTLGQAHPLKHERTHAMRPVPREAIVAPPAISARANVEPVRQAVDALDTEQHSQRRDRIRTVNDPPLVLQPRPRGCGAAAAESPSACGDPRARRRQEWRAEPVYPAPPSAGLAG